jgi:hypothetical protein
MANANRIMKPNMPKIKLSFDRFFHCSFFLKSKLHANIATIRLTKAKVADWLCIVFPVVGIVSGKLVGKMAIKIILIVQTVKEAMLINENFISFIIPKIRAT